MATRTTPVQLTQSSNGIVMKKTFQERLITALLSIATTGIVSCVGFLWNVNSTQAKMLQHDIDADKRMDNIEGKINNIQLDIREDRAVRMELLKSKK